MLWFYTRSNETLKAETRMDNATGEYVLIMIWPSGRRVEERFATTAAFQERLNRLQRELDQEAWVQAGSPHLLADGWPRGGDDEPVH